MDETQTKEVLDFLLSSYRAKLAIQNPTENCPFDFQQFLSTWKGKCSDWSVLKATMKQNLEPLIHQGIFDSIIPYLSASINQSGARRDELMLKAQNPLFLEQCENHNAIISTELVTLTPTKHAKRSSNDKDKDKQRPLTLRDSDADDKNTEITIHVCDEAKNLRQDFKCGQSILVQEMGYFSKVTVKGQKLKDMDISVHCDIAVFEWLMKWVKSKIGTEHNDVPKLEPTNVIGLMVSAEFLQMPPLTEECIGYTAQNIAEVILTSPNLGCLNETLTLRLSSHFDNVQMESKIGRIDKNDRITSRLYTQFTMSLNDPVPSKTVTLAPHRGQFSSTATLFKCGACGRLLVNEVASKVPCTTMRLDCRGRMYSIHTKDVNWSLSNFIRDLKREVKTWRKVYWRLWGTVHFLPCSSCELTFPLTEYGSCRYHPKPPQLTLNVLAATGEIQKRNLDCDLEQEHDTHTLIGGGKGQGQGHKSRPDEECINPFRRQREKLSSIEKKIIRDAEDDPEVEKINCAFGVYPCCRRTAYKYYPLPPTNGCQFREHTVPNVTGSGSDATTQILERLTMFKELIVVNPPKDRKGQGHPYMTPDNNDYFEWGGILDLTPPKPVITNASNSVPFKFMPFKSQGQVGQPNSSRRPLIHQASTSSTEDSSTTNTTTNNTGSLTLTPSDTEDGNEGSVGHPGHHRTGNGSSSHTQNQAISEFWSWNSDFTTRYNQDMQREKEEKLMADLELMLSQRVSLEASSASATASSMRFGYLSRRLHKNFGGSFLKLEEKWREDQRSKGQAQGQPVGGGQRPSGTKSAKS